MPRRLTATTLAALLSCALPTATAHAAGAPSDAGTATVRSVDGPTQLTITTRDRALRIRLVGIDAPRAGECGAPEATAALRGFVRRAPGRFRYDLAWSDPRRHAKDPDGRYLATMRYRNWQRDLALDLVGAGWARSGERGAADNPGARSALAGNFDEFEANDITGAPRRHTGLWATCGGFAHLPAAAHVPATAPVPWTIDRNGIASAVGPFTMNPSLRPDEGLTISDVARVTPIEITRFFGGCRIWAPALQLRFWSYGAAPNCGDAPVTSVRTTGPDAARNADGSILGIPANGLTTSFPLLQPQADERRWPLSGPDRHQWAWQTVADVDQAGRLSGLTTFAAPTLPG